VHSKQKRGKWQGDRNQEKNEKKKEQETEDRREEVEKKPGQDTCNAEKCAAFSCVIDELI